MTDYTVNTTFATKDGLTSGDPNKIIYGSEVDAEFTEIATAVASKANSASPTLTGTPLAPTAAAATNTTQIATTAHVFAERTNTATLTNKTLTLPVMSTLSNGGTVTIPSGTDTLVARTSTDTMTNKTLTSPAINGATILTGTVDGIAVANLVDKSAAETISGDYTFTGTLDFNDSQTRTVMMSTPEALTMTTEGAWTGVAPVATTGQTDILALIVRVTLKARMSSTDGTSLGTGTYTMAVRASSGVGQYDLCRLDGYASFEDIGTDSAVGHIMADSNGDFDYMITASQTNMTYSSKVITAHLIGYVEKV